MVGQEYAQVGGCQGRADGEGGRWHLFDIERLSTEVARTQGIPELHAVLVAAPRMIS